MNQEDQGNIEKLEKSLYSRTTPDIRTKRRFRFSSLVPSSVRADWEHEPEATDNVVLNRNYEDHKMSFLSKFFIASLIFFICALGIGAYLVFNGSNVVSANNIDILINGPISVAGGDPFSFDIQISNKNNIKLETVDLSVDFPVGTADPSDTTKSLTNYRELLNDIEPNGIGQKNINAIIYGEENTNKEIKVTVEYRVKGSNAIFQKEKVFDILVSSSPITMSVSSFAEVNAGQEFEMTVNMTSNSKEVIKNLLLKAAYPFGFNFISSDVKPMSDTSTWKIGDIPPGGKKSIKIKGKLEGQDDESRTFRFSTGVQSAKNDKVIGTEYISTTQEISLKKPFISVGVSIDGNENVSEYTASFNSPIKVEVSWFNNLDTAVIDGEIHVGLSGSAFDKISVSPEQGLYKSATNEIIWNSITTSDLKSIGAGETGRVTFSLTPRDLSTDNNLIVNPNVKLDISVKGKRNSETNVPESIVSTALRDIKIESQLSLGGQVVRSSGPFENTGPIPPKAEQTTTYTILWTLDNTSNPISNIEVHSSLPPYVKWLGKTSPDSEDISYNSVDGQLVWKIASVGTYTSNSSRRRQVAFQVGLNPSVTQVGQAPILVNQASYTAQDDYTGQQVTGSLNSLNTRFSTDDTFKDSDEKVIQ